MGAGGAQGAVSLPTYIEDSHHILLHGDKNGQPQTLLGSTSIFPLVLAWAGDVNDNPFNNHTFKDPTTDFDDVETEWGELDTVADALDPQADYAQFFGKAVTETDIAGRLTSIDVPALLTAARGDADAELAAAIAAYAAASTPEDEHDKFLDAVISNIDGATDFLQEIDFDTAEQVSRSRADQIILNAYARANSGIDFIGDWKAMVQTVLHELDVNLSLPDVDIAQAITDALDNASTLVTEAITAAASAVNNDLLDDVVDSYRQAISYRRAEALANVGAQYVGINAVHTSSFLVALGLVEAQHEADINRFDRELRLRVYEGTQQVYQAATDSFLARSSQLQLAKTHKLAFSFVPEPQAGRAEA